MKVEAFVEISESDFFAVIGANKPQNLIQTQEMIKLFRDIPFPC